ncbi:unnamed protein product, partial [Prorocentrum cordatum]
APTRSAAGTPCGPSRSASAISCCACWSSPPARTRWPSSGHELGWSRDAVKRKSDLWTFRANKLDRGWHDFLAPGEICRYTSPDGFVCIRGALDSECLGRVFLLQSQVGHRLDQSGEGPGSSASLRLRGSPPCPRSRHVGAADVHAC